MAFGLKNADSFTREGSIETLGLGMCVNDKNFHEYKYEGTGEGVG